MFSNQLRKQKQVLKFFILPPANLGTSLYVTQRFGLSYSCHVSTGTHLSLLQTYIMITINISFSCVISVCSLLYRSHLHQPMPGTSAPLSACTAPLQSQPIRRVFQAHSVHFHMIDPRTCCLTLSVPNKPITCSKNAFSIHLNLIAFKMTQCSHIAILPANGAEQ